MPYAILLYFDPSSEATLRGVWKALADAGIADRIDLSAVRPHITLVGYQDLEVNESERRLRSLARTQQPLPVTFSHLGMFPGDEPVVFVAPTVTPALLALQAHVHATLADLGTQSHPYYAPGSWVPHCTLAMNLTPQAVPEVMRIAQSLALPMEAQLAEIGAIEYLPVKQLFTFPLMLQAFG